MRTLTEIEDVIPPEDQCPRCKMVGTLQSSVHVNAPSILPTRQRARERRRRTQPEFLRNQYVCPMCGLEFTVRTLVENATE